MAALAPIRVFRGGQVATFAHNSMAENILADPRVQPVAAAGAGAAPNALMQRGVAEALAMTYSNGPVPGGDYDVVDRVAKPVGGSGRCNGWLRDLTAEGVEANPGPAHPNSASDATPCVCTLSKQELTALPPAGPGLGVFALCQTPGCLHTVGQHADAAANAPVVAPMAGSHPRTPPPRASPSSSDLSPLKAATDGRPDEALSVLVNVSHHYPLSCASFQNLSGAVQAAVRSGTDADSAWIVIQQVHSEWASKFLLGQSLVQSANRRAIVTAVLSCIHLARASKVPVCRLLAGVRGIGKTTLLQLVSITAKVAFGDEALLVVYHDFNQNGRGYNRHSLVSIFREAVKSRWLLTDAALDQRMAKISGADISRVLAVCKELGQEQNPAVDVTVVLFADELQNLFDGQLPSLSLLAELKRCALMRGMATFFSGSAYHLIDGLEQQNFRLHDKMLTVRMLPITTQAELAATQPLWHPGWTSADAFPGLVGATLTAALERRIFLLTGGVLRSMFERTKEQELVQSLIEPPADSSALAVLALLYTLNRSALAKKADLAEAAAKASGADPLAARQAAFHFDPFQQESASMEEMRTAGQDDRDALSEADIRELADGGWLLLSDQQRGTFLRPKHYELMESVRQSLTLVERAAIRFPEGRTLGEQWEVFYAEHLVESQGLRWFDSTRERHLEIFRHQEAHAETFFQQNTRAIFKPVPDTIGFDLLWWSIRAPTAAEVKAAVENPQKRAKHGKAGSSSSSSSSAAANAPTQPAHVLEMHFIQIKVGKLKYDVPGSSLNEALRFALDHKHFEKVQCGQMTGVSQDAAWNAGLVAAAAAAAAPLPAAPTHCKNFELEAHFHLVTSKHVSGPTKKQLQESGIELIPAQDHSFWGPRVRQFCSTPAAPFALFQ